MIKQLICRFKGGHFWVNDNGPAVHGFHDIPYPDSYCSSCGEKA